MNAHFRFAKPSSLSISRSVTLFIVAVFCSLLGCGRGRVSPPYINANQAAAAAIEHYDTDGDGAIAGAELDKAPGLRASRANHNDRITADDIAERIRRWQSDRVGLISFQTQVTLNGRPLGGAKVRLVPEDFLAPPLKPAEGTTDENGVTIVSIQADELRKDLRAMPLMYCGIYRVEITHPQKTIPSKYNTSTILGHEVAMDTVDIPYTVIALKNP